MFCNSKKNSFNLNISLRKLGIDISGFFYSGGWLSGGKSAHLTILA